MIAFPTMRGVMVNVGVAFDADYQAILTKATSLGYALPDAPTQIAGNQLVINLKAAGIWNKLDAFWVYATTGDSNFALLNWKNPNLYQNTIVGTLSFRPKGGYNFSGTSYITTNFNCATNGVQYTQDNASRVIYVTTSNLPAASPLTALDGVVTTTINSARGASSVSNRINSAASLATNADWQGGGLKIINRTDANTIVMTSGLTSATFSGNTSQAITNSAQFVGRTGGGYYSGEIGAYGIGSEMTGVTTQFNSAMGSYFTTMNATLDADYSLILARAAVAGYALPSTYCQILQNDMVVKLKAAGIWNKLDLLYVMDGDASTIDFATLNWKNPNNFQLSLINSPTWTAKQGITTNSTQYFETNWIPSIHAVKYTQDSASVYTRMENFVSGSYIGTVDGTAGGLLHFNTANTINIFLNSTNTMSSTPSSASTHLGRSYSRPNNTDMLYNGITAGTTVVASSRTQTTTRLPTKPIWIGRSAGTYCPALYKHVFFGEHLTNDEIYTASAILMGAYGAF